MKTFKKVLLAVLTGILLLVGSLWIYLFQLGGLERIANVRIDSLIEQQYNLDITIGKVKGDFLSGFILEDVTAYYVDSTTRYLILDVPRLSTAYSLSNLWKKKYVLDYLYIDSATVILVRDSSGRWMIPDFSTESDKDKKGVPSFSIGDLGLNNVSLNILDNKDTMSFDNIVLSVALQGGEDTYSAEVERFEFTSNKEPFSLSTAGGKLTYSEGTMVFKDITLITGETRAKLNGNVRLVDPPEGRVAFTLDNINLAEISALFGLKLNGKLDLNGAVLFTEKKIGGTLDLAGNFMFADLENLSVSFSYDDKRLSVDTLYGTIFGNCTIDGIGALDFSDSNEHYHLNADIKNFNLEELVTNSFVSNLTGHIELQGKSFRREQLLLTIHTDLRESSFDEYPLHEAFGELTITTDSICFADSFRINYFENVFYLSGRIDYTDDIDLTVAAELNNLDRYRGKLFIDQPGGRGHADATISGRTSDPDLRGLFVSDSVWVYDLYSRNFAASVEMERFLSGKKGSVEVFFTDGSAWGQPYDSGYVFLSVDSNLVRIDTFNMSNQYAKLYSQGLFDYEATPMNMVIDTLTLALFDQVFCNRSKIEFVVDSLGFNFLHAVIGTGKAWLSLAGRIDYDESMNLLLSGNHIPMTPWINLFDTTLPIGGYVSCEARVEGTFIEPRFKLHGSIDSLTYRNLLLGALVTGLQYKDRLLTLDSLLILSQGGEYRGTGSFHADLAFTSGVVERFPDLPVDIHIVAKDRRFDLVSLVMPSVEQLNGDFFADVRLSGTPRSPHLEGEAYINNVRLKYFDLQQPIFADSAGVTMKDNRIIIDRIDIYVKDKKRGSRKRDAYLEGEIVVKSLDNFYYDLDVTLPREFPFSYELDDIQGVVEGELHIEGDTPPQVTGDLTIISMKYLVNFATEEEGSPVMRALAGEDTWDLNINIDILANYWIKNDDIDAEFAGQVNLIREDGSYRFIGEMEILRGRGFLFDKTFQLEPGSRVIFEGNPTINPRLDITGYTRIAGIRRSVGEESETTESLELGIHVMGTLEAPEINPAEGSEFSREDILPLIVANYYGSEKVSASSQIEQRLSGLISSQVSQIGARQLGQLGVETFEIDPLYGEEYDLLKARVTVGFYTTPNLYVYGRSTLTGQTKQEVGFEYRFNKTFLLEGLRDEEELYHLALKLHWEF